jgi:endo-alpha-1,4-polygalactosaminidase (GH114 family)
MYSKRTVEKMIDYVIRAIIANYHFDLTKAKTMVNKSAFLEMLQEDPEFVFHYNVEYWAREVVNENVLVCV